MTSPEDSPFDPNELSHEQMHALLLNHGWQYTVAENANADFSRTYPRVNAVLEGDHWRSVIGAFFAEKSEEMQGLSRGFGLMTSCGETELAVHVTSHKDDKDNVVKAYIFDTYLREHGFEDVDEAMHAEWIILQGEPGAPAIGTKAYYEQSERAIELRNLCLRLITEYRSAVVSGGAQSEAAARLLEINQKLVELAIEPDMHVGATKVEFLDPVKRVEWVAGQLRDALLQGYGFSGDLRAVIEEQVTLTGEFSGLVVIERGAERDIQSSAMLLYSFDGFEKILDAQSDEAE